MSKGSRQRPQEVPDAQVQDNWSRIFGGTLPDDTRLGCQGGKCKHDSDCAVHNEPAYPAGPCDCSMKGDKDGDVKHRPGC